MTNSIRPNGESSVESHLDQAATAIREAEAILITAGAGMGVDSGLPDFRGPSGFWKAYPPYKHLGLSFSDMANPNWFERDPAFAWGFYGHRLALYRDTVPHAGFSLLREWAQDREAFVLTSNIDGQFQRAGFAKQDIYEVHGSIHWLQCTEPCYDGVWSAARERVTIDEATFRAEGEVPTCVRCAATARPNVLMFGDWAFSSRRSDAQQGRFAGWAKRVAAKTTVVVEMGAGTAIPTVREAGERALRRWGATLIRINPREPQGPDGCISLPMGAREALMAIASRL